MPSPKKDDKLTSTQEYYTAERVNPVCNRQTNERDGGFRSRVKMSTQKHLQWGHRDLQKVSSPKLSWNKGDQ